MNKAKAMKERGRGGLQECVVDLAHALGHRCVYHTYDSRKSPRGFPDIEVIIESRASVMIKAELKRQKARPTVDQTMYLDALATIGPPVYVYLWRPSHWLDGWIEQILRGNLPQDPACGWWFPFEGVRGDKFSRPV